MWAVTEASTSLRSFEYGRAPTTRAYRPQNVLATLYHVLGIDPSQTFPDTSGRPLAILDDREPIRELV